MIKYIGFLVFLIYSVLLFILVVNMHKKNKVIKYGFIILFITLVIILMLSNEVIINTLLRSMINYLYFPSFTSYIVTVTLSLCILVYSIFNEKLPDKIRIINYVFASLMIVSYVIFLMLEVDITSYNSLYNVGSLFCLRYVTRTFIVWAIILLIIKYFRFFLKKMRTQSARL